MKLECLWIEEGVYLEPALMWGLGYHVFPLKITIEAMKSDIDEVALQGIEFWSNVCDEEMDLAIEASEVSLGDGWLGRGGGSCYSAWALGIYLLCGYDCSPLGKLSSDWTLWVSPFVQLVIFLLAKATFEGE